MICLIFPMPDLISFIISFIRVLTTNNTLLSKLEIGSSITKILSSLTVSSEIPPFANFKKYKKVIKVISPSLNVDSAIVPSSR